jgi:hypothetical protein
MPEFWGADSLSPLSQVVGGTYLANYVINVQYAGAPHDEIVWWGRYFDHGTPSGNDHWRGNIEANVLSQAVRRYANPVGGNSWILPIAAPYPEPGPHSTYATGVADGYYVCAAIREALSSRLHLPGSQILVVFLDVETPYPDISKQYFAGWGAALRSYVIGGVHPIFPGLYINCFDSVDIENAHSTGFYGQSWSYQPQVVPAGGYPCSAGGCDSPGPAWLANSVAGTPTAVWQYSQNSSGDGCAACRGGQNIYVDLDVTNPAIKGTFGYGQCDRMLYINP